MKHLSSETAVKIVAGEFSEDAQAIFAKFELEMRQLQYKEQLGEILEHWSRVLGHRPK